MAGDYSEDRNVARFPSFDAAKPEAPAPAVLAGRQTMATLFSDWTRYNADKRAASTIRRYTPSIESFVAHLGDTDVRLVTEDDVWAWAEKRRDKDGIAPRTINRNGGRRLVVDPARGVKLDPPSQPQIRDKTFHRHEVRAILELARSVADDRYPKATASRRWAPWICAYSGARIPEVC